MKTFLVTAEQSGIRLDVALAAHLEASRARIQKLIKAGEVTVNGKSVTAHAMLHEGESVAFSPLPSMRKKAAETVDIPVIFENDDLVVINKPAGIIVHPMNATDRRTSVIGSLLVARPEIKKVGDAAARKLRPGIVHRLDKAVSGVMVVAKTQKMFDELKRQFAEREVDKQYAALVYGKIAKDHDSILFKIARSKTLGRMVSRPEGQEGKDAHTDYDVVDRFKTATLVDVTIHTGRTHQIRTHFKAIGHPVVGDVLYHTRLVHIKPLEMDRLFLHAKKLSIRMLDGKRKTFSSPLPKDLKAILTTLPRT